MDLLVGLEKLHGDEGLFRKTLGHYVSKHELPDGTVNLKELYEDLGEEIDARLSHEKLSYK